MPPLANNEMNSIFYDVLKLEKARIFKKYFDQHCYVVCFETLFQSGCKPSRIQAPPPPLFISSPKTTYEFE